MPGRIDTVRLVIEYWFIAGALVATSYVAARTHAEGRCWWRDAFVGALALLCAAALVNTTIHLIAGPDFMGSLPALALNSSAALAAGALAIVGKRRADHRKGKRGRPGGA